jgi:hypothetical protein
MIASTTHFPGRGANGKNSEAINPRRLHASIIIVPQLIDHTMDHTQPQAPPTRCPVACLNPYSNVVPTPMRRKNPLTERNSIPCPSPHVARSCITPDTANAPKSAPGRPSITPPGREPNATNTYRNIWCQRNLQKSASEVDAHGRSKSGGHRQAGCRRRTRPMSADIR